MLSLSIKTEFDSEIIHFYRKYFSISGVDFQIKTIRIDEKNVALQLWDTAGKF